MCYCKDQIHFLACPEKIPPFVLWKIQPPGHIITVYYRCTALAFRTRCCQLSRPHSKTPPAVDLQPGTCIWSHDWGQNRNTRPVSPDACPRHDETSLLIVCWGPYWTKLRNDSWVSRAQTHWSSTRKESAPTLTLGPPL
jgi:hypothetical protein